MTDITGGKLIGKAVASWDILSKGGTSKIQTGEQDGNTRQYIRVFDLNSQDDLSIISNELFSMADHLRQTREGEQNPSDIAALSTAAEFVKRGDHAAAKDILKNIGKWVAMTFASIGTPVAISYLKSALNIPE